MKQNIIEKLEAKLKEAQAAYDYESRNSTGAHIAFVAGGNLSRASYHKLQNHRNKMDKLAERLQRIKFAVKLAKNTPLTLHDVRIAALSLPKYEISTFSTDNLTATIELASNFVKGFWRGHILVDYGHAVAVREKGSNRIYMTNDLDKLFPRA